MEELIRRYLASEASASEEAWLRRWRRASPENERRFAEFERIWRATEDLEPPVRVPPPPSAAEVVRAAAHREARGGSSDHWRRAAAAFLAAAALLGLVALVPELRSLFDGSEDFGSAQIRTEGSDRGTLTLTDGSVVHLGPETTLRFTPSPVERSVWLEGKAFFAVASDPSRPFTVRTRYGEVTALGTRFEVDVQPREFQVVVLVVEGRVRLSQGSTFVNLEVGEMGRASATAALTVVRVPDVEPRLEWMGDFLIFQGTPLWRAVSEIERRYDVTITVVDRALADRTVTAWFQGEGFEEAMDIVCRVVEARCSVMGGGARMELD